MPDHGWMRTSLVHVFFFEAFEEEARALRSLLPSDIRAEFTADTIQEYGAAHAPAQLISTRTQSVIPPAWAPALAGILTRSTGFDHASAYLDSTGAEIPCGYLPLYCNRSVAEHALMLWLSLLRRLPKQLSQFGRFHRDGLTGGECAGRTLAVFGVGNIGHEVVRIGRGLDMRVVGVDIVQRWADVDYAEPADALALADVVVCAMNLTSGSRSYFNESVLRTLKRGAVFVNIARGELVDAQALLALLDDGHLCGVGLDVYDLEPELAVALRSGHGSDCDAVAAVLALAGRTDVICTPHNAFNSEEAVGRKASQSIEQLVHFRGHGAFRWPVFRPGPEC